MVFFCVWKNEKITQQNFINAALLSVFDYFDRQNSFNFILIRFASIAAISHHILIIIRT